MNLETDLYRQINPSWIQLGRVTSQAFKPTPKDSKRLSVYDGDQITPVDAWTHYTTQLGYESNGVLAVKVRECEELELVAELDPTPFPSHAVIRFDALTSSQIEKKAKKLRTCAETRGWLYEPKGA